MDKKSILVASKLDLGQHPFRYRKSGVSARSKRGKHRLSGLEARASGTGDGMPARPAAGDLSFRAARKVLRRSFPSPTPVAGAAFGTVCISHSWNSRSWKTNAPDGTFLRPLPSLPRAVLPTGCRVVHCPFIRIVRMNRSFPLMHEPATRHASRIQMHARGDRLAWSPIRARRTDLPVANSACILFLTTASSSRRGWMRVHDDAWRDSKYLIIRFLSSASTYRYSDR